MDPLSGGALALSLLRRFWLPALLCLLLLVQTVRIEGFGVWPFKFPGLQDKYDTAVQKLVEARAELKRISTAKNEQKVVTVERIKVAERGNRKADEIAKKIEQAPVEPGACKTPDIIMGADL